MDAIELEPYAQPAERDQSNQRETGRDYKSELWREYKRADHARDRESSENLAAHPGRDGIARYA